jgi:transcriptional regulator with XRE-family HTH domain
VTGADLKQARELLRMTQAQLAEALGMHANSIARMEAGDFPVSARTAAALRLLLAR